jgi:hypothetical protein
MTVYDTANNVTWLANADFPAMQSLSLSHCSSSVTSDCVNANGSMGYQAAVTGYLWTQQERNLVLPCRTAHNKLGCQRKASAKASQSAVLEAANSSGLKTTTMAPPQIVARCTRPSDARS